MTTDTFKKNPLGADFDPEELVKRLERGENEEEIKKGVDVGPRDIGTGGIP